MTKDMRTITITVIALMFTAPLTGCSDADADKGPQPDLAAQALLSAVQETQRWSLPGLQSEAWVVRTESNVPHIYAKDKLDLARVHAFVAAQDRFFLIDMMRRLGQGRISEVFGDVALSADLEARGTGMASVGKRVLKMASPEIREMMSAYAEGLNAYIEAVRQGKMPAPSEVKLAAPLLGYSQPVDAMAPFTLEDLGGVLALILFQQGYETEDLRRAKLRQQIDESVLKGPDKALRKAGLIDDVFEAVAPTHALTTTAGLGINGAANASGKTDSLGPNPTVSEQGQLFGGKVPSALLDRVERRLRGFSRRLGKTHRGEFGSNIWAVSEAKSKTGGALLCSDGHLSLEVPSIFWRVGIDTKVLGGGDTQQLGVTFAGLPMVGAGTNGSVAWSNTYLYGDITDYYREEVTLGSDGLPASTEFQGKKRALTRIDEVYQLAKIDFLQSPGGAQTWPRWTLFDGRLLIGVEGRPATDEERSGAKSPGQGQAVMAALGEFIVPEDVDGDGVITGISMDLTTLDVADTAGAVWGMAHAQDVQSFRDKGRQLVGWAQNMMAIDHKGQTLYSGYNATPCRGYLPRKSDGSFADDANPRLLIDGTKYGGFEIPVSAGKVDPNQAPEDPYRCVVPYDAWPVALNPPAGYVVNANNDISGTSLDNTLGNDTWYLGGPWTLGYRAKAIEEGVNTAIETGGVSVANMSALQGVHRSLTAEQFLPAMLNALNRAQEQDAPERLRALYLADKVTIDEISARLSQWQASGAEAESGVETFYHQPTDKERRDSVATMVFNAWLVEVLHGVFDDEAISFAAMEALRGLDVLLAGRGPNNPQNLASWQSDRAESVLFDDINTAEIETSDEIILSALLAAIERLRAKPSGPELGGFGTWDIDQWRWGLRHLLQLNSILASFLSDVDGLSALVELFSITTDIHPLAENYAKGDPRKGLKHFPRPGDYGVVDAAHPNAIRSIQFPDKGPRDFRFAHGPIMRMVISIVEKGRIEGVNIIPGGQSALTDSPFFADQVRKWLGNQTEPMRFSPEQVSSGATGREVFVPIAP